jgi:uncharacterized membrane protein
MAWLVLGVLLWSAAHLLKCVAIPFRQRLVDRLGPNPYQGVFSLVILGSIGLMVLGWRSTAPHPIYLPPASATWGTNVAVFVGLVLFAASGVPSNLKRWIRHPQLTGVLVFAAGHLLSNGDPRALVLFGGLGVWSIVAMIAINRRDGAWQKPEPVALTAELKPLIAAVVIFAVLFFVHPWIAGVSPAPR